MVRDKYIKKLETLALNFNFINIISRFILRDFCGTYNQLYFRDPLKHFNYNEAAFIIGIWIKKSVNNSNNIEDYDEALKNIYDLMEEIHRSFLASPPRFNKEQTVSEMMMVGTSFQEAFFYNSVGAYDFQYIKLAKQKYKYDNQWLIDNKGFSVNDFEPFFENIKNKLTIKLNKSKIKVCGPNKEEDLINVFSLSHSEITNRNKAFINILNSFTIDINKGKNSQLIDIGDYNEFMSKPIIKLDSDNYYIPLSFTIAEAMFESPFYWMNIDKDYLSKSSANRGRVAEELIFDMFRKVFGSNNVYKDVKIIKNSAKTITDIDVIVFHKTSAIIVQIKSKKLTALSKQGNLDSIKNDFNKAVENAFKQGLNSKECIDTSNEYEFIDHSLININHKIKDVENSYVICVVMDTFPAISHTISVMLYDKYEESTICFSILDLEVICNYLNKPEKLFDYLIKRVNNCRYYYADNELCFLGFYLESDLKPSSQFNAAYIESMYGAKIDRDYYPIISNKSSYKYLNTPRKISRNEKCPCGSGKKNKDCHRYDWFQTEVD